VSFVSGSYSNVVGLPLFETVALLKAAAPREAAAPRKAASQ
jgi:predicted house-cleaning NTP pyrophosphatase (Maf/HAM1 superfamily)